MQSCQNCGQKFSFAQIYKSFWYGYRTLVCHNCKTNYEHSFKNRWIGAAPVGLGILSGSLVQYVVEASKGYQILVGILVTLFAVSIISGLGVYLLTFENEEKAKKYT